MDCETKEMVQLTDEQNKSYQNQNVCPICKVKFTADHKKSEIIVILLGNLSELQMILAI